MSIPYEEGALDKLLKGTKASPMTTSKEELRERRMKEL